MDQAINFPHLGIYLEHVGKTFRVFGIDIAYYGVVVVTGMLIGLLIVNGEAKRLHQNAEQYWDMGMIALISGIVGARIYYVIFDWDNYKGNLLEIFNLRHGGLAIYGGIIGALIAVYIYGRIKKLSFPIMVDCIAPGLVIGQVIGRWGNFFNREAFGGYTDNLFAMQLPVSAVRQNEITRQMWEHVQTISGVDYIQVHPTFLYEGLWNIGVFLVLWLYRKHKKFDGEIFLIYLVLYGMGRLWIEGLRTDQLLLPVVGIPVSQIVSVGAMAVGIILIVRKRLQLKKGARTQDVVEE